MGKNLVLRNVKVVGAAGEVPGAGVWVRGGRIEAVAADAELAAVDGAVFLDGGGRWLVPGFIDIHTHGAAGFDTCDGTVESIRGLARAKLREGVTTLLPTTLTAPHPTLRAAFESVAAYRSDPDAARVPGLHVEGPFINPKCAGAQNPEHVRPPDVAEIADLAAIAPVVVVSLAVEMSGGIEFVRKVSAMGVVCSLAHTAATHSDYVAGRGAGIRHLTHFGNQMTPLHHREIGVVGSGLGDDGVMIELICDLVHLCPEMLQLLWKVKDPTRLMAITDSMAASGLPDGSYTLGGLEVVVRDRQARLGNGALAGSTARYFECFRNLAGPVGIGMREAVMASSTNQARSLGWSDRGDIAAGLLADLVLLDPINFEPAATFVGGEPRWWNLPGHPPQDA